MGAIEWGAHLPSATEAVLLDLEDEPVYDVLDAADVRSVYLAERLPILRRSFDYASRLYRDVGAYNTDNLVLRPPQHD